MVKVFVREFIFSQLSVLHWLQKCFTFSSAGVSVSTSSRPVFMLSAYQMGGMNFTFQPHLMQTCNFYFLQVIFPTISQSGWQGFLVFPWLCRRCFKCIFHWSCSPSMLPASLSPQFPFLPFILGPTSISFPHMDWLLPTFKPCCWLCECLASSHLPNLEIPPGLRIGLL